jgi:hypothetical protein
MKTIRPDPKQHEFNVTTLLSFESKYNILRHDVDKLLSAVSQHGLKIKELTLSAANSVSSAEFMTAIATTRYQSMNLAKSITEKKKADDDKTGGIALHHDMLDEGKDSEVHQLKLQINNLESELYSLNFKNNLITKNIEHEKRLQQQEVKKLTNYIEKLEDKLIALVEIIEKSPSSVGSVDDKFAALKVRPPSIDTIDNTKHAILSTDNDLQSTTAPMDAITPEQQTEPIGNDELATNTNNESNNTGPANAHISQPQSNSTVTERSETPQQVHMHLSTHITEVNDPVTHSGNVHSAIPTSKAIQIQNNSSAGAAPHDPNHTQHHHTPTIKYASPSGDIPTFSSSLTFHDARHQVQVDHLAPEKHPTSTRPSHADEKPVQVSLSLYFCALIHTLTRVSLRRTIHIIRSQVK